MSTLEQWETIPTHQIRRYLQQYHVYAAEQRIRAAYWLDNLSATDRQDPGRLGAWQRRPIPEGLYAHETLLWAAWTSVEETNTLLEGMIGGVQEAHAGIWRALIAPQGVQVEAVDQNVRTITDTAGYFYKMNASNLGDASIILADRGHEAMQEVLELGPEAATAAGDAFAAFWGIRPGTGAALGLVGVLAAGVLTAGVVATPAGQGVLLAMLQARGLP